jgi:protein-disulfide isomerase
VIRLAIALVAIAALTGGPSAAASRPAAHAAHDWAASVVATPDGGFQMGNPAARVKLVEYGSLACPHCRHFEETGYAPLVQHYVRSGRISYEFRNLLLNAPDIAVSLLAHCAGPAKFFPMAQAVYSAQPQWFAKVGAISEAQAADMDKLTDAQRVARIGDIAGFPAIAARFGMTPARVQQCLADPKGLERLLAVTKGAEDRGINHTPTFLIDGKVTEAASWEELEPELKKALGG